MSLTPFSPHSLLRPTFLALALALLGCATTQGPASDLRLRRVVLYQNGIGYFERVGVLQEERLRLSFREREIDDVLKSLVVVEEGAGTSGKQPSTVSARLPEAKTEGGSPEDTTWLDVFLSPRTDSSVSIAYAVPTAAWKATYRVILPDPKGKDSKRALLQAWALIDNVSEEDWNGVMLTLATGAPLSFTSNIRAPRFVDRPDATNQGLGPTATGPVLAERSASSDMDGDGVLDAEDACPRERGAADFDGSRSGCPRAVRISSNEIMILEQVRFERDSDAIPKASLPVLDAIAQILKENPQIGSVVIEGNASTDESGAWALSARRASAVNAALLKRGVKTRLQVQALGDTRPIGPNATEEGQRANRRVQFKVGEAEGKGEEEQRATVERKPPPAVQPDAMRAAGSAAAAPHDVAGSIRYDIQNAISIPRRSSALVTIINEYVPGEDVYLFRPDPNAPGSDRYPMRAARIQNGGSYGLQPGSVTIFSGGTFAGEGLIDKLNPGDKAMIPYALDSSSEIVPTAETTERPVRLISIARGVMTVENVGIVTTKYEITVGRQAPGRIFIRHPRRADYTVQNLPADAETTTAAYLIPVPISPGSPSVLTVEERQSRRAHIAVLDAEGARLGLYLAESTLPTGLDQQVRDLIALRGQLAKLDEEMDALRARLGDAAQRSAELRESIRAVERTPKADPIQKKLMAALAEATAETDKLSISLVERGAAHAEARARLVEGLRDVQLVETAPAKP